MCVCACVRVCVCVVAHPSPRHAPARDFVCACVPLLQKIEKFTFQPELFPRKEFDGLMRTGGNVVRGVGLLSLDAPSPAPRNTR